MAFLDALELVMDAALTDKGRELISKGDGSFKITQFAPVDTEINYALYDTSLPSLTAPANILNTPILEALTNESTNEQYELMTISDPKIRYLPRLNATSGEALSINEFSAATGQASEGNIVIDVLMTNRATVPAEIIDSLWFVYVNDLFLEVSNYSAYLGVDSAFNYAGYAVDWDGRSQTSSGKGVTVTVKSKPISSLDWTTYGTGTVGLRTISTNVRIKGAISGLCKNILVTITEQP